MTEHLSTELIERYRQRRMEPEELLRLDGHLTQCAACRGQLRAALSLSPQRLHAGVFAERQEERDHLSTQQLRSYLRRQLDAVDRELFESHLEVCADCQRGIGELQQETQQPPVTNWFGNLLPGWLKNRPDARTNWFSGPFALRLTGVMALLAFLIWGLVWGFMRWRQDPNQDRQFVRDNPTPTATTDNVSPPSTPAVLLALNDGGRQVTLDADGNLAGFESLSIAEQEVIKTALSSERVKTPAMLAELASGASKLMGPPNADPAKSWAGSSSSTLLSPFAEVVVNARPTMSWKPLTRAEHYVVTINDPAANYREIAVSPKLTATRWTAPRSLPRGRTLTWQVTAFLKGDNGEIREVTAPAAEAPEAKCRVLTRTEADELARGRKNYAGQHLPLGLLYARLGLLREAERELQSLVANNSQNPIPQLLLRDLRDKRQTLKTPR